MTLMTEDPSRGEARPLLDHLSELRTVLVRSLIVFTIAMLSAIPLAPYVIAVVRFPAEVAGIDTHTFLQPVTVAGGMSVGISAMFWTALLLSCPFIVFFIWQFIMPGLRIEERVAARRIMAFAGVLFAAGVALCYFVTLPIGLEMILAINRWLGIEAQFWTLESYVSFVLKLCLAFGIAFELPVFVLVLGFMGFLPSRLLREKRRHAIVGLLVFSMLLTPQDPYTMLLMALPLIALYECCIWLIRAKEKRRN